MARIETCGRVTRRLSTIAWCLGLACAPLAAAAQPQDAGAPRVSTAAQPPDIGAPRASAAVADADVPGSDASPDAVDNAPDAGADDAVLAARRIIDRALEQAAEQRAEAFALGFEYFTDGRMESLDGERRVTDAETTRNRHYPLEGHFYTEVIGRDGGPLDEDEAREERRKKADFLREVRRHAERGERYQPDEMRVDFDHELMNRYVTALVGTEVVDGAVCWVIGFEPREGRLPDRQRLDRAMNRSSGRLWIAQHDHGVRRAVFEMQEPVRWLWGIAGTLRRASGELEFRRIEPGLWIPDRTLVEIELGVFFGLKTIRRRILNAWVEPEHAAVGVPAPQP